MASSLINIEFDGEISECESYTTLALFHILLLRRGIGRVPGCNRDLQSVKSHQSHNASATSNACLRAVHGLIIGVMSTIRFWTFYYQYGIFFTKRIYIRESLHLNLTENKYISPKLTELSI